MLYSCSNIQCDYFINWFQYILCSAPLCSILISLLEDNQCMFSEFWFVFTIILLWEMSFVYTMVWIYWDFLFSPLPSFSLASYLIYYIKIKKYIGFFWHGYACNFKTIFLSYPESKVTRFFKNTNMHIF